MEPSKSLSIFDSSFFKLFFVLKNKENKKKKKKEHVWDLFGKHENT